jgi:demethylmenaquinone methyltransferase/2-methoxy-6-polyprenyl-1,4-benzoquinol methylase
MVRAMAQNRPERQPLDPVSASAPADASAPAPALRDDPGGDNPEATRFGYDRVAPADKTARVRGVFDSVARRYDVMNDLMSGGLHRLWKDRFVARLQRRPGMRLLDLAGGTGDIAQRAWQAGVGDLVVLDLNEAMLTVGRERARRWPGRSDGRAQGGAQGGAQGRAQGGAQGGAPGHTGRYEGGYGPVWIAGDAAALPLASRSVDAVTIAFGLRNVTYIDAALREIRRVLRPGGQFLCLEFSRVILPVLDRLYDAYSFTVLPRLGAAVAGDAESYRYLAESIRTFPDQQRLARRMTAAGFERVGVTNVSAGIVAIHEGWRL